VYDMYPWNSASRGDDPPRPPRDWGEPSPQTPLGGESIPPDPAGPSPETRLETPLVQAVQIALDRRDNGGDGVGAAGQPTASRTRQ
jgi:hypothetical protein